MGIWHLRVCENGAFPAAYLQLMAILTVKMRMNHWIQPIGRRQRNINWLQHGETCPAHGHVYPAPYSQSSPVWCVDHLTWGHRSVVAHVVAMALGQSHKDNPIAMGVWPAFGCFDSHVSWLNHHVCYHVCWSDPNFYFSNTHFCCLRPCLTTPFYFKTPRKWVYRTPKWPLKREQWWSPVQIGRVYPIFRQPNFDGWTHPYVILSDEYIYILYTYIILYYIYIYTPSYSVISHSPSIFHVYMYVYIYIYVYRKGGRMYRTHSYLFFSTCAR